MRIVRSTRIAQPPPMDIGVGYTNAPTRIVRIIRIIVRIIRIIVRIIRIIVYIIRIIVYISIFIRSMRIAHYE